MKSYLTLMFFITGLIPAFAYADAGIETYGRGAAVEVFEKPLTDEQKKAKDIEDKSKRGARDFLAYDKVFGDIAFGDPVEKLGEERTCSIKSGSTGDMSDNDEETMTCTVAKDYGKIEGIPVFDVEYVFHKAGEQYLMTAADIFLYRSEEYFSNQYHNAVPGTSERLMSAPKTNYAISLRCNSITKALSNSWGGADEDLPAPRWIDGNHHVSVSLVGVACNVLKMESIPTTSNSTN